jgi:hypothetical protein
MTRRSFFAALAATAVLAAHQIAWAHPGHVHKVMGTVTTLHENHLEVRDVKGVTSTHTLDAKTKIRRGKTALAMTDLKVGDRVVVSYTETKDKAGNRVVTVTEVQVGTATTAVKKG